MHHAARLCAAGHGGQVLISEATRGLVKGSLPAAADLRHLGQHRLRDLPNRQSIYQLTTPDLAAEFPPLRSLDALPNNLPTQLTSFIGREREMAEVKRLLEATRLLTLTGTGGAGKTRLALTVAADLLEAYPDGVWLVELAPLADPALVPQTVAMALGLLEDPRRPLIQTLTDFLKPRSLLLMLDNCEHWWEPARCWPMAAAGLPPAADPGNQPRAAGHRRRDRLASAVPLAAQPPASPADRGPVEV